MKRLLGKPTRLALTWVAIALLSSVPVVAQIQFTDVDDDDPHRRDILEVAENRWFVGYADGTYKPDRKISASEMTRVLTRAFPEGITRAEFASFIVAGNQWKDKVKQGAGFQIWRTDGDGLGNEHRLIGITRLFAIAWHPDYWIWSEGGEYFLEPGTYLIDPSIGHGGEYVEDCRWMRLGSLPDGSLNFDTVAATNAPLAAHFRGDPSSDAAIVRISSTDAGFLIQCGENYRP